MNRRSASIPWVLSLWVLVSISSGFAWADKRVALVIGNSHYQHTPPLGNPINDATEVSKALAAIGFDVTLKLDVEKRQMDQVVAQFARTAKTADVVLFYYAGHGMQFDGKNFIMPVDAELQDEVSLRYEMTAVDDVKAALQLSPGVRIMVLDSCRSNPLADRFVRSISVPTRDAAKVQGFARSERTQGMIVVYATQADEVANDGEGRNSPFTAAFLKEIKEPGLEVGALFRRVGSDVFEATHGLQSPELSITMVPEFYLNQTETDRTVWARIRANADASAIREFLDRYPESFFAPDARARLDFLESAAKEKADLEAGAQRQRAMAEEVARLRDEQAAHQRAAEEARSREEELMAKLAAAEASRRNDTQTARDKLASEAKAREQDLSSKLSVAETERQELLKTLARHEKSRADAEEGARADLDRIQKEHEQREAALRSELEKAQATASQFEKDRSLREALEKENAKHLEDQRAAAERERAAEENAKMELDAEAARAQQLKAQISELEKQLDQDREASKRQAAQVAATEAERAQALKSQIASLEQQAAQAKAEAEAEIRRAEEARQAANAGQTTPPPVPTMPGTAAPATSGDGPNLVAEIERELRRVGCFNGADADWNSPQIKLGMTKYAQYAKLAAAPEMPDAALLAKLKSQYGTVCPLPCRAGETVRNGRCVVTACPAGEVLSRDGVCVRKVTPRPVASRAPVHTQTAAHSSAKCFTFAGSQYCE